MTYMRLTMSVMALVVVTTAAAARSSPRLVIIVGFPDDPRVAQQHAALEQDAAALHERAVVVKDITPEAAQRERPELALNPQVTFEVLLIGKDGEVKLRRETPVAGSEIAALIDTMPMRQNEMKP